VFDTGPCPADAGQRLQLRSDRSGRVPARRAAREPRDALDESLAIMETRTRSRAVGTHLSQRVMRLRGMAVPQRTNEPPGPAIAVRVRAD